MKHFRLAGIMFVKNCLTKNKREEFVSELVEGSLSSANLITVCANHHRQLHYGKSYVQEITERKFVFHIDNKLWDIKKLSALIL